MGTQSLPWYPKAEVAELADAHGSGPCTRKGVGVRVPSSAPEFLVTASHGIGPSLRSGFRLRAPARRSSLTPAEAAQVRVPSSAPKNPQLTPGTRLLATDSFP